jgi:hypothetical protein
MSKRREIDTHVIACGIRKGKQQQAVVLDALSAVVSMASHHKARLFLLTEHARMSARQSARRFSVVKEENQETNSPQEC